MNFLYTYSNKFEGVYVLSGVVIVQSDDYLKAKQRALVCKELKLTRLLHSKSKIDLHHEIESWTKTYAYRLGQWLMESQELEHWN